jgi:hypothetical protein
MYILPDSRKSLVAKKISTIIFHCSVLNALADDPNSNRSISTYTKRNTTQTRIEHEFGMADHADSNRFYLVFTFIDAKHPQYESEFEQVCL